MADLSNLYLDLATASDSGVGDDTTVNFVLSQTPKSTLTPLVTVDGIKRRYTTDYTITLGTKTLSFVVAPKKGQIINATYPYV